MGARVGRRGRARAPVPMRPGRPKGRCLPQNSSGKSGGGTGARPGCYPERGWKREDRVGPVFALKGGRCRSFGLVGQGRTKR